MNILLSKTKSLLALIAAVIVLLAGCQMADSKESGADRSEFNQYWYSGKAEITRYALEQARYGEVRKGDAVLIFVTEDFLSDKQVKYEFGDKDNAVSILKMNATKKFYTGIYPYSIMTSVFTPVDGRQPSLKVTTTSQEWCGHTFMQFNHRDGGFDLQLRSYFQAEGDQDSRLPQALLEDEIWTRIRLAPATLPVGKIEIIPAQVFSRLRHQGVAVASAQASLSTIRDKKLAEAEILVYTINYDNTEHSLTIKFEKGFPHQILAWEETFKSGFGPSAKVLTTRAVRTKSIRSDYWAKNKLSDSHLRDELGLIY